MMIKKPIYLITCGLVFVLALTGATLQIPNLYMDSETERDVLKITGVHLLDVSEEEVNHFNVVKEIRFTQLEDMKREARAMKDPEDVKEALRKAAVSRNLVSFLSIAARIFELFAGSIPRKLGNWCHIYLKNWALQRKEIYAILNNKLS